MPGAQLVTNLGKAADGGEANGFVPRHASILNRGVMYANPRHESLIQSLIQTKSWRCKYNPCQNDDELWSTVMTKPKLMLDHLKDRRNIGKVEQLIDKLKVFRDAEVSCVHIEARLEAGRGLSDAEKP